MYTRNKSPIKIPPNKPWSPPKKIRPPLPFPKIDRREQEEYQNKMEDHYESIGKGTTPQQHFVDKKEIEAVFNFFDVKKKKKLTYKDIKARLQVFYPHMTNKDFKFLVSEQNFTLETLTKILENNTLTNFDPMREAFRVFDPNDTGYIDASVLKSIMSRIGYGNISDDDMQVLIQVADCDKDGKISYEDFVGMTSNKLPEHNDASSQPQEGHASGKESK